MAGSRKLKACIPCTKSKRKCGKELPECERCIERDIDCSYLPVKWRRREGGAPGATPTETTWSPVPASVQPSADLSSWSCLDLAAWDDPISLNIPEISLQTPCSDTIGDSLDWSRSGWFLGPGTWNIERNYRPAPPFPPSVFKDFIATIQAELRQWTTTGSNGFIHSRAFCGGSLPPCLADAFTTVTTYISRTPATEDMVLDIVETRAAALLGQYQSPLAVQTLDVAAHLARVQALLVYQVIRLFDGCVRQRALAEAVNDTILQWAKDMYHATAAEGLSLQHHEQALLLADAESDDEGTGLWRAWVVAESVRRTWIVVTLMLNVYVTRQQGWAECNGGVMFTTRKGLWDASSASSWLEQAQEVDPLFVPSLKVDELFVKERACDVDEFALKLLPLLSSADKVETWVRRTRQA
ncbi:hypothetical protein NKR23_g1144 [Pleurostoma richardsiae]|uniref:Zn(2)-C6 fungal-type domain-containing protein n=1 Tax=Pleurostoma richardsiae TaxID=41990 RepID=A0AA38RTA3_9PEZI|nr:hypothetical protein NKR23_g1144 [Pleurostoma richardsiae]